MRLTLAALGLALTITNCGTDEKKNDDVAPPSTATLNCGSTSDNLCAEDWFDTPNGDPFDPNDPGNQDPFPPFPDDDDPGQNDDKKGPSKPSKIYMTAVESYLNLKQTNDGQTTNQGSCHIRVDVSSHGMRIRVKRTPLLNKEVGLGKSRSCLVKVGLRYRDGYKFRPSKIYTDLITDLASSSWGQFELDYRVLSRGTNLEYNKKVFGPEKTRHNLTLTPKYSRWSSCSGRETLGLKTFFETNYKNSPEGDDAWKAGLVDKKNNNIDHGDLYLDEGEYRIKFRWSKCY